MEQEENQRIRLTLVFQYLEDNLSLSRLLLNSNADPSFAEKLFALPKIGDLMNASLKSCTDSRKKHAVISFAIHGSYHLLQEWINSEQRLCAGEQGRIILGLARRVCTDLCSEAQ